MPVNYEQLRIQMKDAGKALRLRHDAFSRTADLAEAALRKEAESGDIRERVEAALAGKPDLRCAIPGSEPVSLARPAPSQLPVKIRLAACDGSQISPSRHDEISFGLINTAIVEYTVRSGETPRITTRTQMLPFDDLPSENLLGVRRDAAEKSFLAEYTAAADHSVPIFAICDGPLELFTDTPELKDQQALRDEYLEALVRMAGAKVPAVGYIDRPRSDPVIRMLSLLKGDGSEGDSPSGADDGMLFSRLLGPGERSAVFGMNSRLNRELEQDLRLCFFYINVGRPSHPYISRVEIPAWAADEAILDMLHSTLLEQCRMLGGHPYPFILHRAHECAVITFAEKEEIKGLLLREMAANGMTVPEKSSKQIAKDLSRRNYSQ